MGEAMAGVVDAADLTPLASHVRWAASIARPAVANDSERLACPRLGPAVSRARIDARIAGAHG